MLVVKSDDSDDDPDAGPSEIQPNIRFVKNLKHVAQGYKTLHKYRTCLTEVGYWGKNYVFAGSDCGNVLLWDKHKPDCIMMLNGNHMLVNSVQAHPTLPILAAGGGLGLLKLFMPTSEYSLFDDETIPEVKRKMAKQACYRRRLSSPIYVVYGLDG
uniref:Uncharacterized protein n=1 Tax=Anopheles maculatus TaxID=74869 RepID=A0A182SAD1_9DIPT